MALLMTLLISLKRDSYTGRLRRFIHNEALLRQKIKEEIPDPETAGAVALPAVAEDKVIGGMARWRRDSGALSSTQPKVAFVACGLGDVEAYIEQVLFDALSDYPLTVGILPGQPRSVRYAELAHRSGFEVMIQTPLGSLESTGDTAPFLTNAPGEQAGSPGQKTIIPYGILYAGMDVEEAAGQLRANMNTVPYAAGFMNWGGRYLLLNRHETENILKAVHRYGLYILEAGTAQGTYVSAVAEALHMPYRKADLYLGYTGRGRRADYEEIDGLLDSMLRSAGRDRAAVCVLWANRANLAYLTKKLPELRDTGIHLSYVSELVE